MAEILAALSRALDMTEGQPRGHSIRTALISQRLSRALALSPDEENRLFYGALLKDAGCSTNAARIQAAFGGDELVSKRDVKFVDWSRFINSTFYALAHAERGGTGAQRLRKVLELARTPRTLMDDVTLARCVRGADIARQLGFEQGTSDAIRCIDEHWDGNGAPSKLRRDQIPLGARVLCLAQTLELFEGEFGVESAYAMLRRRSGRWFDPQVVRAAESLRNDAEFWSMLASHRAGETDGVPVPYEAKAASHANIDDVCVAFASIVDAKSSYTAQHSSRVTEYALALGVHLGLTGGRLRTLRRAAMLHDLGKLGVSNAILDKPGRLSDAEWRTIRAHPRATSEILDGIRGFSQISAIAAAHHERLDGKGYHLGVGAESLTLDMRILAAADVFDALTANRPYRAAMPVDEALQIMGKDAGQSLDLDCVQALRELFLGSEELCPSNCRIAAHAL
jgi:HD-GYP domain-containing protein (c-di-GMP phosphodiesterase class II)